MFRAEKMVRFLRPLLRQYGLPLRDEFPPATPGNTGWTISPREMVSRLDRGICIAFSASRRRAWSDAGAPKRRCRMDDHSRLAGYRIPNCRKLLCICAASVALRLVIRHFERGHVIEIVSRDLKRKSFQRLAAEPLTRRRGSRCLWETTRTLSGIIMVESER